MDTAIEKRCTFVELLAKSNFSFLQAASHPEEMVQTAKALGYSGLGLCDSNGLYGVVRGFKEAHRPSLFDPVISKLEDAHPEREFRFLVGSEVLLLNRQSISLIPVDKKGYSHLCRLLTLAKRNIAKYHSRIGMQDLLNHAEGLLLFPMPPWDKDFVLQLHQLLPNQVFFPICRDKTWASEVNERLAFQWEEEFGISLFVSQMPVMHHPSRKPLHDSLVCIQHKLKIEDSANHTLLNRERNLKPLDELYETWQDRPDLLRKTVEIADRVQFSMRDLRYHYPHALLPENMTVTEFLQKKTAEGLLKRYPAEKRSRAFKQLDYEIRIISKLEYEDYFLTLWDVCEFARAQGILFQGRGSAANSIVCYTLGLTAIDPLDFSNTFERFLSERRGEPPDIDIDFEHQRREEVIQYIYRKYGPTHSGMVCTVIRYRARMALRELCKVFDIPLETVNKMVRYMGKEGLKRLENDPPPPEKIPVDPHKLRLVLALTRELIGFPRHIGIHTGGFVISHNPLVDSVPIEKATMDDRYVVQWNKDDIDTLGMMKVDVLSLGMLTALKKGLDLLRAHKDIDWQLSDFPDDDKKTYDMIQEADTVGVFQIESRAQMSMLPRLKPGNFYDLVIEVAIVRPGPLQGGMVHPFLQRRQGKEPIHYPHKDLKPILEKTMGVPIFQEQVLLMSTAAAGFTPAEAEELRRLMSMSWRKEGHMSQLKKRLFDGMKAKGITPDYCDQIYKMIEGFASYGFPESHAASFALLTYASSYMKAHHPEVFVCSLLNSQPMGFYSSRSLIADARRHGVEFLPLDIQTSDYDYTLERRGDSLHVRVGMRAIYGLSKGYCEKLVSNRKEHGAFENISDLISRTRPLKSYLLKLATANAFWSFGQTPRQLTWWISSLELDQNSLSFSKPQQSFAQSPMSEWIPAEDEWQRLLREYHSTGICLDSHPLKLMRPKLDARNKVFRQKRWVPYTTASGVKALRHGNAIRVAGIISVHQKPPTAKGFVFLTLEDETGMMNIVVKPPIYKKYRDLIQYGAILEVQGFLEHIDNVYNIQSHRIISIDPRGLMYEKMMPAPSCAI